MKKYFVAIILVFICVSFSLPVFAASGKYVASKNSKVFHDPDCPYVDNIQESNKVWFRSISGATASGRRQCSLCTPEYGDYVRKESEQSGNSGNSSSGAVGGFVDNTQPTTKNTKGSEDKSKNEVSPIFVIAVIGFAGYWVLKLSCEYRENKARVKARKEENAAILGRLGVSGVELPKNVALLPDGTPTIGDVSDFRPFGDYTVYIAAKGNRYHKRMSCCKTGVAHHLFKLPPNVTPCQICAKGMDIRPEVPMWYRQIENKSK